MRSLLLIVPLATGCLLSNNDGQVAPLSSFHPYIRVTHEGTITFEHYGDNLDSNECLLLGDDVEATLNGIPFEVIERGGAEASSCVLPVMRLAALPEASAASVVIRDRTTTLSCDLGDTLTRFPIEHASWQLPVGDRVTVHATRPADTHVLKAELVVDGTVVDLPDQTQVDSDVSFTVPGPYAGTAQLRMTAQHDYSGPIDNNRCGGLVFTTHVATTPITFTP